MWEFEYPMDGIDDDGDDVARSESGSLAKEERYDIFNTAGGSVAKMDNGAYFVAFNAAEVFECAPCCLVSREPRARRRQASMPAAVEQFDAESSLGLGKSMTQR